MLITSYKFRYALYFGRISEEKGTQVLIEAAKSLPEVSFIIAGNGPMEDRIIGSNILNVGLR